MYEQLPYLKSLGVGALILQGLFDKELSPSNSTATSKRFMTLAQIQHLLAESNKIGELKDCRDGLRLFFARLED